MGISLEIAAPKFVLWLLGYNDGDYTGVGIDVGMLKDRKGKGFYATIKTTQESGVAFSIQGEAWSATMRDLSSISRMNIYGSGYELSAGIGPFGGSYGVSSFAPSDFQILTGTVGVGLSPLEYIDWNTNTYVSGKRKF